MGREFDCRKNSWGHAIYPISKEAAPAGSWKVSGCLTPLPKIGDTVIAHNGQLFEFKHVNYWRNPADGFDAIVAPLAPDDLP